MTKGDEEFLAALKASMPTVVKVFKWLEHLNYDVAIKENRTRPDFNSRMEYADEGDIEIRKRVEVKHRPRLQFTSALDYPFSTIFVDEVYKIDRRPIETLSGYVIVNATMTHAAIIMAKTRKAWVIESRYDRTNSEARDFYACPAALAQFVALEE